MEAIAPTRRGRERRERLLNATAELVAERDFHSVGIADIGAAAGVTGSAIYRHFRNKADLLVALMERVVEELLGAAEHDDHLAGLVRRHAEFAIRDRALLAVYAAEQHNVPAESRRRLRRRQRDYVDAWARAISEVRPDLGETAARSMAHAVIELLNSVPEFPKLLPDEQLLQLLVGMADAAVRGAPSPSREASR
ncbi:MAG: regulatory protein TetR [Acidimicrobiales bacterium]|jgi:AcrR family transcriptional regulator|nr:regulatory protein TetR [Acidimicrobiales bacterium]